ncbi:MAG: PD40 domain-containing protein [Sandaracinaceae bacterium]|nr:PD40 domain-containing protein [Sandaracinaceae bacterium]
MSTKIRACFGLVGVSFAVVAACTPINEPIGWQLSLVSAGHATPSIAADAASQAARISADGSYLVFESRAHNLGETPTASDGVSHIYIRDLDSQQLRAITSYTADGVGRYDSLLPSVSRDGMRVAFATTPPVLVPEPAPPGTYRPLAWQVYEWNGRDAAASTILVTQGPGGGALSCNSGVFDTVLPTLLGFATAASADVVVMASAQSIPALPPDGGLVPLIAPHIIALDIAAGVTTPVPLTPNDIDVERVTLWPDISDDGDSVVFSAYQPNSVPDSLPPHPATAQCQVYQISNWRANVADANMSGVSVVVAADGSSEWGNASAFLPVISGDGKHVAFNSAATNLSQGGAVATANQFGVWLCLEGGRVTGQRCAFVAPTGRSAAGSSCAAPGLDFTEASIDLSVSGRYLAFSSKCSLDAIRTRAASCLSDEPFQVFVFDVDTSSFSQITHGNDDSYSPSISDDGTVLAFTSRATNLVPVVTDTNLGADVYVARLAPFP